MTSATVVRPSRRRVERVRVPLATRKPRARIAAQAALPGVRITLEGIEAMWWSALDAADAAVNAAACSLPRRERSEWSARIAAERALTFDLLQAVARATRTAVSPSR